MDEQIKMLADIPVGTKFYFLDANCLPISPQATKNRPISIDDGDYDRPSKRLYSFTFSGIPTQVFAIDTAVYVPNRQT